MAQRVFFSGAPEEVARRLDFGRRATLIAADLVLEVLVDDLDEMLRVQVSSAIRMAVLKSRQ